MKSIQQKNNSTQSDLSDVKEILKCKSSDDTLCVGEAFAKALLDTTSAIICIWSLDGKLIKLNSFGREITGYSKQEVIGDKWRSALVNKDGLIKTLEVFEQFKAGIIPPVHETPIYAKDGRRLDILWANCIIFDRHQAPHLGISIGTDITDKKRAEAKIRHLAYYDSITGLPNRSMLMIELNKAIFNAKQRNHRVGLIFIDLDNFKSINDTYGHTKGDELLKKVGRSLSRCFGNELICARLGGDEFIILMPVVQCKDHVTEVSQRILNQLKHPFRINGKEIYITASIGVATFPDNGKDGQGLLKNADIALFSAKFNGKNQYKIFEPEMEDKIQSKLELANDLRKAVKNNEFVLYYQPQVSLSTGKINGMEALIRWNHPVKGIISPGVFIPIAEETGLINEIGDFVLRSACLQNKIWHDKCYSKVKFSVNISSIQFQKENFIEWIEEVLSDTGVDSRWLEIEITESVAMKNFDYTIETLNKLREHNVSVALDDFGTGYSSLNYLNKLPVDKLKIDKSFLDNVKPGSSEEFIAKAIIGLAFHLNLTVVAEGIETEEQIRFLSEQNCVNGQGYFFSKPLPAYEFEKFLKNEDNFYSNCSERKDQEES